MLTLITPLGAVLQGIEVEVLHGCCEDLKRCQAEVVFKPCLGCTTLQSTHHTHCLKIELECRLARPSAVILAAPMIGNICNIPFAAVLSMLMPKAKSQLSQAGT